ncbi:hypothetical protein [Noviherbaspirillum aridicola]|uniref:DUF4352 domain-containing protein n=1 Tax=Noviherbaspirillum aridicola TaxID=2849687 RepID=A0ABQ4Q033_9BURK|nr:hypothetical protein [Noviherbaspirillum aridicola]GIZ50508.1 hypothetical protein NCCP691_05220 [Noviherbaspirillum aridicola]
MKTNLIPALFAAAVLLAACGKEEPAPAAPAAAAPADMPAVATKTLGTIDTDSYSLTLHRAISFTPKTDALGLLKTREGHRYVVLDIGVTNKGKEPLEMGTILLFSKVTDKNGKSYGGNLGALTAYTIDHPDPKHQDAYDAVLSMEFPAGATHRAVVLGLELPQDVKELVFSAPVRADMNAEMKQIGFTLD